MQVAEEPPVQTLRVRPCAQQPSRDRALAVPEGMNCAGDGESFRQGGEHQSGARRRGFEAKERGVPAHSEFALSGLPAQVLDRVGLTLMAITDQGLVLGVGIGVIQTVGLGAGKAHKPALIARAAFAVAV